VVLVVESLFPFIELLKLAPLLVVAGLSPKPKRYFLALMVRKQFEPLTVLPIKTSPAIAAEFKTVAERFRSLRTEQTLL
jgi:hypothetical protein